jgi:hypothetical protein
VSANDSRNGQIDSKENEGGQDWLKFQPQGLPARNFRQSAD